MHFNVFMKHAWLLVTYWGKSVRFNYTEKSMWSNGYFLMSQGFRGSCLEGKLIAEFTKQAWNVCWSALGEDERVPFLGSEDASWPA